MKNRGFYVKEIIKHDKKVTMINRNICPLVIRTEPSRAFPFHTDEYYANKHCDTNDVCEPATTGTQTKCWDHLYKYSGYGWVLLLQPKCAKLVEWEDSVPGK